MSDGLIDPDAIPLPISLTNLVMLESAADSLKEDGESIAGRAHDIRSSWSGLQGLYQAPEAETLFSVLDPVPDDGESVESDLSTVSGALNSFAERARELRSEMVALKTRAHVFLASIEGDDDWDEGGPLGGENPKVAEHNELLNEVTRIQTDYMEAERDCANAITALFGGPVFVPMNADGSNPPSGDEIGYGLSEPPVDMPTDWGSPQGTDHHWYVDVTHSFGDWTTGAAVDLAGATGLHYEGQWGVPIIFGPLAANPWTNPQGTANAQNYGQDTFMGLMYLSGFYTGEAPPRIEAERELVRGSFAWELDGWTMPSSTGEWWDNAGPYWTEVVEGVLRLDEWEERPGYAITQIALDAGAGGGALKALRELNSTGGGGPDAGGVDANPTDGTPEFGGRAPEGVPSPEGIGDTADRSRESDALESLDSTLDRLAEHQNGSPTGPPAHSPDPAGTPVTPQESSVPPGTASPEGDSTSEANGAEVPERANVSESDDAPVREGAESGAPEPTTREEYEALVRAEMVRNDPELREILEDISLDLPERVDAVDPDAPWTTSAVREPEMAMAGTGGGGNGGGGGPVDTPAGGSGHAHVDAPGAGSGGDHTGATTASSGNLSLSGSGRGDSPASPSEGPHGPGDDKSTRRAPDAPPEVHRTERIESDHELFHNGEKRFAEGLEDRLTPNTKYEITGSTRVPATTIFTDENGDIRYVVTKSGPAGPGNPELVDPRPNATYRIEQYTYKTDHLGRTVSVEGELTRGRHGRNDQQTLIGYDGQDYYRQANKDPEAAFANHPDRDSILEDFNGFEDVRYNGSHIIGGGEYGGAGERINVIPLQEAINQVRTAKPTIADNFRRLELTWKYLIDRDWKRLLGIANAAPGWETQVQHWQRTIEASPEDAKIYVKFDIEYDDDMSPVNYSGDDHGDKNPKRPDREINPPPAFVNVAWSLNGVDQGSIQYENSPRLK
ncbi:DNA/RNA non-specific endonuclease [Nocardiopsis deserti]|uniref:DNA/RNA non-specific endonuclease n=1 Tax=Nocardiopsis deserti TaxID=2605988 RepID=UPI00123A9F7F|nr:DNA/RNA non-specific endonuclease [Nocardiopsis deserti]